MLARFVLGCPLLVTACAAPPLQGGPQHPRWQSIGGGPAADRLIVGNRYDPTGRVDGYFQGDRRIGLDELLRLTDHDDIADKMARRRTIKPTLEIIGGVITVVGLAYGFTGGHCTYVPPNLAEFDRCSEALQDRRLLGAGIAAGGAAITTVGWFLPLGRPSDQEISYWASNYNHERGIPPIPPPQPVQIGATATAGGGSLVVRGAF